MSKAVSISFPVKSAADLASELGVSKASTDRIFAIVESTMARKRSYQAVTRAKAKSGSAESFKSRGRTSRSRQRINAKNRKAAAR